ncbi:Hypp7294 [Branchiostoma lanceolatum]|uniref:Hypp7294 protein n=1 Tax=Branchiostoma lanceolatum TaxID=7740 RepID=A0A8J9YYU0_BRALA|nr:Hypp7294 [Branchiostoma lanceolatum]
MAISCKRCPTKTDLFYGNTMLAENDELEILGVTTDSKLTWTKHISNIAAKAGQRLGALRRVAHKFNTNGRSTVYKAQVRSIMEYAFLCWMSAPTTSLKLMDSIQRKALRIIGVNEQQARLELNIPSLHNRPQVAATAYKMHTNHVPQPFNSPRRTTRSSQAMRRHALTEPVSRTHTTGRTFTHASVSTWNALPDSVVRDISTRGLQSFKTHAHRYLLQKQEHLAAVNH